MEEFFFNNDESRKLNYVNQPVNELYVKYFIVGAVLVMFFLFCKNYKLDNTKRIKGKVISIV
jgi:hypothetical protein